MTNTYPTPVSDTDTLHPFAAEQHHAQVRVEIDWQRMIERRPAALKQAPELPKYLLLPEINALLDVTLNDSHHLMFDLLWHTGARVSELLSLTPAHFDFTYQEVSLESLKQKKVGRPRKKDPRALQRVIPIPDPVLLDKLQRYFETHRPGPKERLFPVTPQTVQNRIDKWAKTVALPFRPTPHTFRHSFAVNHVLHHVPIVILQKWMGHKNIESTVVYTNVLNTETWHHMRHVQFQMPGGGARTVTASAAALISAQPE